MNAALLNWLWSRVADAGRATMTDSGPYEWSADDDAMRGASDDDLLAWAEDMESRLGADAGNIRAALLDYCIARDGGESLDRGDRVPALAAILADAQQAWEDDNGDNAALAAMEDAAWLVARRVMGEALPAAALAPTDPRGVAFGGAEWSDENGDIVGLYFDDDCTWYVARYPEAGDEPEHVAVCDGRGRLDVAAAVAAIREA